MTDRAEQLAGEIVRYEADSDGHVYACFGNGVVLPSGFTMVEFASRSDITVEEFREARRTDGRLESGLT